MNAYEEYLENMLELKDKELDLYKNFIEKNLRCKIRDEVQYRESFSGNKAVTEEYRIITIPESKYIVRMGCNGLGGF